MAKKLVKVRNYFTALILSALFGMFGVDRFYLGCIGTGVLKLLTFGGFGIWALIDLIRIAFGSKLCGGFVWNPNNYSPKSSPKYMEIGSSSKSQGGGCDGCTESGDMIFILVGLLLGGLVLYFYLYPWMKVKYYGEENTEEAGNEEVGTQEA